MKVHESKNAAYEHAEKQNAKLSEKAFATKRLVVVSSSGMKDVTIAMNEAKILKLSFTERR